jgi:hypothetical protein
MERKWGHRRRRLRTRAGRCLTTSQPKSRRRRRWRLNNGQRTESCWSGGFPTCPESAEGRRGIGRKSTQLAHGVLVCIGVAGNHNRGSISWLEPSVPVAMAAA